MRLKRQASAALGGFPSKRGAFFGGRATVVASCCHSGGCQQVRVLNCPSLPRAACLTCFKFCARTFCSHRSAPATTLSPAEGSTLPSRRVDDGGPARRGGSSTMRAGCCASERASAAGGERFHVEQAARAATATATATVTATGPAETQEAAAPRRAAGRLVDVTPGQRCSGPGPGARARRAVLRARREGCAVAPARTAEESKRKRGQEKYDHERSIDGDNNNDDDDDDDDDRWLGSRGAGEARRRRRHWRWCPGWRGRLGW